MCVKDFFLSLNLTTQMPQSGIHTVFVFFVTGLPNLA